jgi:hypothetical protein
MADPYFEQPSWEEEQRRSRETLAQQEKEIAENKAREAAKKEARSEEEKAAEYQEQVLIERQQAISAAEGGPGDADQDAAPDDASLPILAQIADLDGKIADLEKKSSNAFYQIYLFLTVGAVTVDVLQAAADFSTILSILASGLGLGFSVVRHYGLKLANPHHTPAQRSQTLQRTLTSGAISMIPFVDMLPEQTMFMVREFTVKKGELAELREEIRKLGEQRKKLVRTLPN